MLLKTGGTSPDNGKIITSAGLSSGIDAALHLVQRLRGVEQARSVALRLEYDWQPEGGFIRSLMADRYLAASGLEQAIAWPDDIAMRQQFAVGDEQHWRMRFDVNTATPADELLRRIGEGLDSLPEWTRQAGAQRWSSRQEGRGVALEVAAVAGASDRAYVLELTLWVQPDAESGGR